MWPRALIEHAGALRRSVAALSGNRGRAFRRRLRERRPSANLSRGVVVPPGGSRRRPGRVLARHTRGRRILLRLRTPPEAPSLSKIRNIYLGEIVLSSGDGGSAVSVRGGCRRATQIDNHSCGRRNKNEKLCHKYNYWWYHTLTPAQYANRHSVWLWKRWRIYCCLEVGSPASVAPFAHGAIDILTNWGNSIGMKMLTPASK